MSFTEFYCNPSSGDNLNAGSTTGSSPYSSNSGNWVQSTRVFTPTDGSTPAGTVNVGDFASVYPNGSSSPTGFVARVTAVAAGVNGTITLDGTAKIGSSPSDSTGGMTIRVGGAWKGPNGSEAFPFGQVTPALVNTSGNPVRVNLKNSATYSISAGVIATWSSVVGYVTFQGCSSSVDDGGKAIIDGGGGTFDVITFTGSAGGRSLVLRDLIVKNSGGTGLGIKLISTGTDTQLVRVAVSGMSSHGFSAAGGVNASFVECEAYANGGAGFSANGIFAYCISHDNTSHGFTETNQNSVATVYIHCIADTNGGHGFLTADNIGARLIQCDAYNNTSDGLRVQTSSGFTYAAVIQNCNFIANGGYGINQAGSGQIVGILANSGFGSGTAANTSGQTNIPAGSILVTVGTVTYASNVTPWADPANGDFRVNLSAAKGAGRGAFTETASSYAGAVGYPDIGSNQHQDAGGMIMARVRTGF